jgi:hypothetical protein
MAKEDAIVTV